VLIEIEIIRRSGIFPVARRNRITDPTLFAPIARAISPLATAPQRERPLDSGFALSRAPE
jgi:hypothetical protein